MINCGATGQCEDLYLPISFEVRTLGEDGLVTVEDTFEPTFGRPAPSFMTTMQRKQSGDRDDLSDLLPQMPEGLSMLQKKAWKEKHGASAPM